MILWAVFITGLLVPLIEYWNQVLSVYKAGGSGAWGGDCGDL